MDRLIRQLAVLAVLWTVCELLTPSGRLQQITRAAMSLLVLTALLSSAGAWLGGEQAALPAAVQQGLEVSQSQYRRTALTAFANQVKQWCESYCRRAGYEAWADVTLRLDGALEKIDLTLNAAAPLMSRERLVEMLAGELDTEAQRICLTEGT